MTPMEIIMQYDTARAHTTCNEDLELAREAAVQDILNFAREMCDKQKVIIKISKIVHGTFNSAIHNAPYPKELL